MRTPSSLILAPLILAIAPASALAQTQDVAATGTTQAGTSADTAAQPVAQGNAPVAGYPIGSGASYVAVSPYRRDRRPIPYVGGPVPLGTHVETRRNVAPLVLGAVGFALTYLPSLIVASNLSGTTATSNCAGCGWLFVPVAGPFIALGYPLATDGGVAMVLDGLFQAASVAALFVGFLNTHHVLVPEVLGGPMSDGRAGWAVVPGAPGSALGASFSMTFF